MSCILPFRLFFFFLLYDVRASSVLKWDDNANRVGFSVEAREQDLMVGQTQKLMVGSSKVLGA